MLVSELEAYGPEAEVELSAAVKEPTRTEAFVSDTVTLTVRNPAGRATTGRIVAIAPDGWTIHPAEAPIAFADGDRVGRLRRAEGPRHVARGRGVEADRDCLPRGQHRSARGLGLARHLRGAAEAGNLAEHLVERHCGITEPEHEQRARERHPANPHIAAGGVVVMRQGRQGCHQPASPIRTMVIA